MGIKPLVLFSALVVLIPLLTIHCKQTPVCPKEGYVFTYINSKSFYNPSSDSIPLGDSIVLTATLPAGFVDETTHKTVYNLSSVAEGPLHIVMLQPNLQGGADYFTIKAETGHIFSDSVHFSANALKGFRTLQWAAFSDSFKIKLIIKPLVKGTFEIALGQQSSKDQDCALYKYFTNVDNDQHLYYLSQVTGGYIGDYERAHGYCFRVY